MPHLRGAIRSVATAALWCAASVAGGTLGYAFGATPWWPLLPPALAVLTSVCVVASVREEWSISLGHAALRPTHPFATTAAFAALCAFALASGVSASPVQQDFWGRIAGALPFRDAERYYDLMATWPNASFDQWNARRPLNGAVHVLEAWLVDARLRDVLLVHVTVVCIGVTSLVAVLIRHVGRWAALAVGVTLTTWMLTLASSCRSEPNGLALCAASLALLLHASDRRNVALLLVGLMGMLAAYLVRPCNPVFPVTVAGVACGWCLAARPLAKPWALAAAALMAACMAVIPGALTAWVGEQGSRANSNAGFALLGFAMGEDWWAAAMATTDLWQGKSEAVSTALIYERTWQTALDDPTGMIRATIRNLTGALVGSGMRGNSSLGAQIATALMPGPPWSSWAALPIAVIALAAAWRLRPTQSITIAALSLICFVIGAPVLWGSGGWRPNAILFPGLALLVAMPACLARRCALGATYPDRASDAALPETSQAADASALLAGALAFIPALALAYVSLSRADLPTDPRVVWPSIEFSCSEPVRREWISPTSVRLHPSDLARWADAAKFPSLADFVHAHGQRLIRCRREHNALVLEVRTGPGDPPPPKQLDHRFRAVAVAP
jgi:hypothetical protein